jgi:hypothetical protein
LVCRLETKCQEFNQPLDRQAYLGAAMTGRIGAQHTLNADISSASLLRGLFDFAH